jgi:hypothetical protein
MTEHPTGRVKPSPAQPKMGCARRLWGRSALAPTQPGIPGGPGVPIAAAPRMPTPPPKNVKA